MRGNRTDNNHKALVAALRVAGAVVVSMAGDPAIGFDLLVAFRGKLYAAEVKDGSKAASARRLTEGEQKRLEEFKRASVRLHIWETTEQALADIGAIK
jgi:hypothetical protein